MTVFIRRVDEPVYDGSTGAQIDTHTRYELGGEIDGTFVPFANVRQSFVGHLQRLDKEQQAKAAQQGGGQSAATSGQGSQTTTTAGEAAQNLNQPGAQGASGAPQAEQVPTEPQQTTGETA